MTQRHIPLWDKTQRHILFCNMTLPNILFFCTAVKTLRLASAEGTDEGSWIYERGIDIKLEIITR
jgi:hypothetical protein